MKIGLLEKKVESIDSEIARQVAVEKEETARMKQAMENQEKLVLCGISVFILVGFMFCPCHC